MVTRRQADRIFRECFPLALQRARKIKRQEWFQSLSGAQRFAFMDRVTATILERYGELPRPLPLKKRFPHTDPSNIQILSISREQRRLAVRQMLAEHAEAITRQGR